MKYSLYIFVALPVAFFIGLHSAEASTVSGASNSNIAITISAPVDGSVLMTSATGTVTYKISGLPSTASSSQYQLYASIIDAKSLRTMMPIYIPVSTSRLSGMTLTFMIPSYYAKYLNSDSTYKVLLSLRKKTTRDFTPAELTLWQKYYPTVSITTIPKPSVLTEIASATSAGTFTIIVGNTSMILDGSYYADTGTVTITTGSLFDVWGGRFELRLDKLTSGTAYFTKFFDGKPVGTVRATRDRKTSLEIAGMQQYADGTSYKIARVGTITYTKSLGTVAGVFTIATQEHSDMPKPPVVAQPYYDPVVTTGRATVHTAYLSPSTILVTGSYNDIASCDAGVQYNVTYDDGATDSFITDGSCKKVTFTKTHTFTKNYQRNYLVQIEMYAVRNDAWTHFVQSASLVRVQADGSLTTEQSDLSSWMKG